MAWAGLKLVKELLLYTCFGQSGHENMLEFGDADYWGKQLVALDAVL